MQHSICVQCWLLKIALSSEGEWQLEEPTWWGSQFGFVYVEKDLRNVE